MSIVCKVIIFFYKNLIEKFQYQSHHFKLHLDTPDTKNSKP